MCQISCILAIGVLGLSSYAVGTLPDYVSEDANPIVRIDLRNCGNGKVDPGEECDCGTDAQKCREDPCCQTTCQWKLHAQCSIKDPCCSAKCKFKSKGTVCQIATHDCGISEYCTGDSSRCSASSYKRNGANCTGDHGRGICVNGVCKSFEEPCPEDSVNVASKCPPSEICNKGGCAPARNFINGNSCPKANNGLECAGQGECTTSYQCHCGPGWKGYDCSAKDDATKINDEKPGIVKGLGPEQRDSTSNTTALVGGLVSFVIIVSIIFVVAAFRYIPSRPPKEDSGIYPPIGGQSGEPGERQDGRPAVVADGVVNHTSP